MSTQKIKFKIVTPERSVFEQEIDQATLPVSDGEVGDFTGTIAVILRRLRPGK